ncbi:MAG: hypothetical protein LBG70_03210 [Bifidobacteriaceae bacterium]|jgi:serine/threonine protein kinase|nr:hypothetical protein [Bifidobacteriaceae bacterium]
MGRYRLERELTSTHPWAFRWLAHDRILRRSIEAHLLIGPHVDEAIDAARRAALVNDPRLVRVIDAGRYGGTAFVLTDLMRGQPLSDFAPLRAELARCVAGEVATALQAANLMRVRHLTLRPELIYLGDNPILSICGLGWDSALWGHSGGDPREQAAHQATDVVALLYAALTGRWPGPTPSFMQPPSRLGGAPIPPSDMAAEVPGDLDTLCRAALDPSAVGPTDLAELIGDLGEWIGRVPEPPALMAQWPLTVTGAPSLLPMPPGSNQATEIIARVTEAIASDNDQPPVAESLPNQQIDNSQSALNQSTADQSDDETSDDDDDFYDDELTTQPHFPPTMPPGLLPGAPPPAAPWGGTTLMAKAKSTDWVWWGMLGIAIVLGLWLIGRSGLLNSNTVDAAMLGTFGWTWHNHMSEYVCLDCRLRPCRLHRRHLRCPRWT